MENRSFPDLGLSPALGLSSVLKWLSTFCLLSLSSSGNIFHPNLGNGYGMMSPGYFKRCASCEGSHSITSQLLVCLMKSYPPDWGEETQNG